MFLSSFFTSSRISLCPVCKHFFVNPSNRRKYCTEKCSRDSMSGFSSIRQQVLKLFGNVCFLCGGTHKLEVHHILMRSYGGTHDIGNLVVLCAHCHDVIHAEYNRALRRGELNNDMSNVFDFFIEYVNDMGKLRPYVP